MNIGAIVTGLKGVYEALNGLMMAAQILDQLITAHKHLVELTGSEGLGKRDFEDAFWKSTPDAKDDIDRTEAMYAIYRLVDLTGHKTEVRNALIELQKQIKNALEVL